MIFQDVRQNALHAYKYKAYYDTKTSAWKLRECEHVSVVQTIADHCGRKIPWTDFRWIVHYIVEKSLPNNNSLVRKIRMDET